MRVNNAICGEFLYDEANVVNLFGAVARLVEDLSSASFNKSNRKVYGRRDQIQQPQLRRGFARAFLPTYFNRGKGC